MAASNFAFAASLNCFVASSRRALALAFGSSWPQADEQSHATNPKARTYARMMQPPGSSLLSAIAQSIHQGFLLAAVDVDHRAVDEEGEVGSEKRHGVGNLLGLGEAPERNARRREPVRLLEAEIHVARHRLDQAGPALGAHRAGIDAHEADIVLAVL